MEKLSLKLGAKLLMILAVDGFVRKRQPKHFMGLMNTDVAHSIIRVPVVLAALMGSLPKHDIKTSRAVLTGVGVLYLAIGTAGLADRKLGGALPSRLTWFDIAYHFAAGAAALWLGTRPGRMMKP